ncbi:hypothetical protein [Chenggangzhangella methanolivorans]|uniref:Uncharacterized protein n=1 Tax=Chenggangzhangella methanolivorans TaxID=1437009 RepID=A0A9E6RD42_9HYPH|nr:hypothetical protein [Chenggangzhangella methanolivorans]QZO01104.1 hypothetical protein K6K41_05895 [Chenggangzhangella methanolivorans]
MLDRADPPLSEADVAAMKLLLAERALEIRNRQLLLDLEARGFVRQSIEGWSVTIAGHLAYLKALANSL